MRERLTATARKALTTFNSFTAGQKSMTVVAVLALAVGGYFFANWASKPTYAPLFTNLSGTDASAIVDKLTADGVSYQLTNGGSTILVPQDQVYAERIKMSGAGLPSQSDAGYALLDKQSTMTSEFLQQVGYRRALEGELAKTVKSIDGVTSANVHLAIPKKDVYSDTQQKPTASVLVATTPGRKLTGEQVQAVVHLVASSVEGLEPEQVTVVGSNGAVLSTAGQAAAAAGDLRSRQTSDFEGRMNSALQRMLDQALGPGRSVVQVTADLDFDSTETTTQRYVADPNTPPLSQSTKNETYNGAGTPVGGVLGPDNIQVPGGTNGGTGQYSQQSETRNNAVGLATETRKSAPGAVRRLAVAVLVDSAVAQDAEAARLQQLVASAAGLDTTRGDTIAVSAMRFDSTAANQTKKELEAARKADSDAQLKSWIETGAIVGGVLILLLAALISTRRQKKRLKRQERERERIRLTAEEQAQFDQMQAALEEARQQELAAADAAEEALEAGPNPRSEVENRRREIVGLIEKQPDEVAQLLRSWLADRRH